MFQIIYLPNNNILLEQKCFKNAPYDLFIIRVRRSMLYNRNILSKAVEVGIHVNYGTFCIFEVPLFSS